MSQIPRSERLYKKAEAALISSIEIYNKPDFKYREETFAILALNAWELLLKAKLLVEHKNDLRKLFVYEYRKKKSGVPSKKKFLKRSRSGNPQTLTLGHTIAALEASASTKLSAEVTANLDALVEIRDNAIHFVNISSQLAKQVLEIGTASLKNFVELSKKWFNEDLSGYSLFLMPIGFMTAPVVSAIVGLPGEEKALLAYLASLAKQGSAADSDFHIALEVNLSFKRTSAQAADLVVAVTNDPNAPKVIISEENIRKSYPWDFGELTKRVRLRYLGFKSDEKYHKLRKAMEGDPRFARSRYLDPGNTKSPRKTFYSPNIIGELDKNYTLNTS
jgi:hypothetical protein